MKKRNNKQRFLAVLLAFSMLGQQAGITTLADEVNASAEAELQAEAPQSETPAQTEAPKKEEPAQIETPKVEAPAQTEVPPQGETPAQTEAPQTEAPAQTEAPQSETPAQTEAPQSEAPTQTEAPQSETPTLTEGLQSETPIQTESDTEVQTEALTESESETENKEAELQAEVKQEAFNDSDGSLAVKYTVTVINKTDDANAEDVTIKAVLGKDSFYYDREGQSANLNYIENINQVPGGLDLNELKDYSADQLAPYTSAVVWQDQKIAGGAQSEYVFFTHVGAEAQSAADVKAMFFVEGKRVGNEKIQWIGAELIQPIWAEPKTYTYENEEITISVEVPEGVKLPYGSELSVRAIEKDSEEYEKLVDALETATENKKLAEHVFYDISFLAGGQETEPQGGDVIVNMNFKTPVLQMDIAPENLTEDDVTISHIKDDNTIVDVTQDVQTNKDGAIESLGFITDSFSVYAMSRSVELDEGVFYNGEATVTLTDGTEIKISGSWDYFPNGSKAIVFPREDGFPFKGGHVELTSGFVYDVSIVDSNENIINNAAAFYNLKIKKADLGDNVVVLSTTNVGSWESPSLSLEKNTRNGYVEGVAYAYDIPALGEVATVAAGPWRYTSDTFTNTGGSYSLGYILNKYNVFVQNGFKGTHIVGPVVAGGTVSVSLGGSSTSAPNYVHDVPDYCGSLSDGNNRQIITSSNVSAYLGTGEQGKDFVLIGPDGAKYYDYYFTDNFVDFDSAMAAIKAEAASFSGTETSETGTVDLAIGGSYEFTSDALNGITELNFIGDFGAGNDTFIIVKDSGDISIPKITSNGSDLASIESGMAGSLVFLFPNAVSVNGNAISGHIVAPDADVTLTGGYFNGCVIAKSLNAEAEGHMWNYNGKTLDTSQKLELTKTVDGETPKKNEIFQFKLEEFVAASSDGSGQTNNWTVKETVSNSGRRILFREINYTEEGTHWYRISEESTDKAGYSIDTTKYVVKIVINQENDILNPTVTYYRVNETEEKPLVKNDAVNEEALEELEENSVPGFDNKKITGAIKACKKLVVNNKEITDSTKKFYVALFTKNETENQFDPVENSKKEISAGETVTWDNLDLDTQYYVFETDQNGTIYSSGDSVDLYTVTYSNNEKLIPGIVDTSKDNPSEDVPTAMVTNSRSFGKIELDKIDAANSSTKLAGAVFSIYTEESCLEAKKAGTLTTGNDGHAVSEELTPGTYYVKETTAPRGYVKSETVYTVIVTAGQTVKVAEKEKDVVTNKLAEAEVVLAGQKKYQNISDKAGYKFVLYASDGATNLGEATTDNQGSFTFAALNYKQSDMTDAVNGEKTFSYMIKEDLAGTTQANGKYVRDGVYYDSREIPVNVTVKENADGSITIQSVNINGKPITETGGKYSIPEEDSFLNYSLEKISVNIPVKKNVLNLQSSNDKFTFALTKKDTDTKDGYSDEDCKVPYTQSAKTIEITGTGNNSFAPIYFNEPGTYVYTIKESDFNYSDYTKDQSEYEVTVTVSDTTNGNGEHVLSSAAAYKKVKDKDGTALTGEEQEATEILFNNTYNAVSGVFSLEGTKIVKGGSLAAFQFGLFENKDDETPIATAENNTTDGKFTLTLPESKKITMNDLAVKNDSGEVTGYETSKDFTYYVKEISKDGNGYTVSDAVYEVVVTMKNGGKGTLEPEIKSIQDAATGKDVKVVTFENKYTAENETDLTFTKALSGTALTKGQFSFILKNDGDKAPEYEKTVSNGKPQEDTSVETPRYTAEVKFDGLKYTMADLIKKDTDGQIERDSKGNLQYETSKIFVYTLNEVTDPKAPHYTYDESTYELQVTVTNQGNGTLDITKELCKRVKDDSEKGYHPEKINGGLVITNYYTIEGELQFSVNKKLTGQSLEDDQFTFTLSSEEGTYKNGGNTVIAVKDTRTEAEQTVSVKKDGTADFKKLQYDQNDVGKTYCYVISEQEGSDKSNYTYDGTEYKFLVTITDEDGTAKANVTDITEYADGIAQDDKASVKESDTLVTAKFVNSYTAEGGFKLEAVKAVEYRKKAIQEKEFTFDVYELTNGKLSEKPVTSAAVSADGKVDFEEFADDYFKITADTTDEQLAKILGTHTYIVAERKGIDETIDYSSQVYRVQLKVTDDRDGKLEVTGPEDGQDEPVITDITAADKTLDKYDESDFAAEGKPVKGIVFTNTYLAIGQLPLEAEKILENSPISKGQFSFELKDEKNNVLQTKKNDADGKVIFENLKYDQTDIGKNYTYTVSEVKGGVTGVAYDETLYTINVKVEDSDGSDGTLKITSQILKGDQKTDDIIFENKFSGSVTLNKTGADGKVLAGAKFQLYQKKDGNEWTVYGADSKDGIYVTNAEGVISVTNLPANEYYFVETEAPKGYAISADENGNSKQYHFLIGVKDGVSGIVKDAVVHAELNVVDGVKSEKASIKVTKTLTYNGEPIRAVDQTFYVALYYDEACTKLASEVKAIRFQNSSAETVEFTDLELGRIYYVGESNEKGITLLAGKLADGTVFTANFTKGNKAVVENADGTATVYFENQFMTLPNGFYKEGELTITKKLIDVNGTAKNSDETFYAGIFADKDHKVLSDQVSENIVALKLAGGSQASTAVKVSLTTGESTKLYVTEVDANGMPVEDAADFEYEVSVDNTTVTLDDNNTSASVTITNKEVEEEETETTTEKGKKDTSGKSVKTGDETPIAPVATVFGVSALLLAALLLIVVKRRKRDA